MQDTVTSRELFERMPTRPALAEPEVAAHKVREFYGVDDNRPKEALEDDEHPWWYMTAR